jgi:hypothetical protein
VAASSPDQQSTQRIRRSQSSSQAAGRFRQVVAESIGTICGWEMVDLLRCLDELLGVLRNTSRPVIRVFALERT